MICKSVNIDISKLNKLKSNHYTRRIKSHFLTYKTQFNFLSFYEIIDNNKLVGIICCFNSSMVISTCDDCSFNKEIIEEVSAFILLNSPYSIELEFDYADVILCLLNNQYKSEIRTEFEFKSSGKVPDLFVNECPKLDDVYLIIKDSFNGLKVAYELWLTDTSYRIRHETSRIFLFENCTTATVQYLVDDVALVGNVATVSCERGKFYARNLLYWIGEKMAADGKTVKLFARPHRVSYYEEILFKEIGTDIVLERKY